MNQPASMSAVPLSCANRERARSETCRVSFYTALVDCVLSYSASLRERDVKIRIKFADYSGWRLRMRNVDARKRKCALMGELGITRRGFLQSASAVTGLALASSSRAEVLSSMWAGALQEATPRLSSLVKVSTPDKSIEESFWISARLTNRMRQLANEHYGKDGWLAVSDGKNQPQIGRAHV